nr:hypothetical protein [Tanacetum cinerariifolium]
MKQSQELKHVSYHKLYDILKQHQHEVNEIRAEKIARVANPLALVSQQQQVSYPQTHPTHFNQNSLIRTHQSVTRKREKAVVNSPQPIYDQEASMVDDDDEDTSKDKEIDKLMALISLSFKKIYKPTNNNLRTLSNTSRANQDNSLRIHRNAGYEGQWSGTVAGARDTVGSSMVQKSGIQCYNYKEYGHVAREWQKPKRAKDAAYHREKMLLKREKAVVNSPQPIYDQEPSMVNDDDEDTSKEKEIDKLMDLISLSFKKIYKPTNNNLHTSSNTSRANQDNSLRIHINVGDDTDDESDDQELEAHYMYMAKIQQVSPDVDDSGPIFDKEPEQKVQNDDHYDVFAIECRHSEQSESVHNTYLIEQDAQNVLIESEDMTYDSEQIDQNDEDVDLAKERELLASLIEKLKCEIDESKNRNTLLETSNKVLVAKLKSEIADFKNKYKSLTEANNKLSE